jgi:hypothetical protein
MNRKSKKKTAIIRHIQYVLPIGNAWVVKFSEARKCTAITLNKSEAVSIARDIAIAKKRELIVFFKNGKIQERISYAG